MAIDPITAVLNLGSQIIDKVFPDRNVSEQAKLKMMEIAQAGQFKEIELLLKQIEVNAIEAASDKWWKAGWRPFCGWVCGSALAYHYIVMPFLVWVFGLLGFDTAIPALDIGELMTVLFGLLGLGGLRTYEKIGLKNIGRGE